jgi:hypothetical protein
MDLIEGGGMAIAGLALVLAAGAGQQETYGLDGGDVLFRQDPGAGKPRRLPPTAALALKYGLALRVEDPAGRELAVRDEGRPTAHGPTMSAEGEGPYAIRAPLARYVFEVPASPPPGPQDSPLVEELARRVEAFVAAGPQGPLPREYGYTHGLVFWFEGETVAALSQALPYLPRALREKALPFLRREVETRLLDAGHLAFERAGKAGIVEWAGNTSTTGQAIAALWDYARYAGDEETVRKLWPACRERFDEYLRIDWTAGCNPRGRLHVARTVKSSDINAQFAAASAAARLARRLGDREFETRAAGIAARLLVTRYAYGVYVRPYLYEHGLAEAPSRVERGLKIDTLPARERFPHTAWPYDAPKGTIWPREMRFLPDGSNDPRVVVEPSEGPTYRVGMIPAGANLKSVVLHYPMPPELGRFLGERLGARTREIFDAFQANMPWWHWSDYETIIERGDETVASPDTSFSLYQTLAWALGAPPEELRRRLPWEYLNVGFRDRYRLINLGTLLRCRGGARWEEVR